MTPSTPNANALRWLEGLPPGYFAVAMASGILSIAFNMIGQTVLAEGLFVAALLAWVTMLGLSAWRMMTALPESPFARAVRMKSFVSTSTMDWRVKRETTAATPGAPSRSHPGSFRIGATLVAIVTFGSLIGSMLPFILRRCGFDPASASAPFVATFIDVTGLVIYFTVALAILSGTLL